MVPVRHQLILMMTVVLGLLVGCTLLDPPRLTVVASSPADEFAATDAAVWLEFSESVRTDQAERLFSLTENGVALQPRFSWNGNRLTAAIDGGLKRGALYLMRMPSTLETPGGVDLDKDFKREFRCGSETGRPTACITAPADDAVLGDPWTEITVSFGEAVDKASFREAFSVSPAMDLSWTWAADGLSVTGRPLKAWSWQTDYRLRVSTALADLSGNVPAAAAESSFRMGAAVAAPAVSRVAALAPPAVAGGAWTEPGTTLPRMALVGGAWTEVVGWEATWGLRVEFDQPVKRSGLENLISVSPAWDWRASTAAGDTVTRIDVVPASRLTHGSSYELVIASGLTGATGVVSEQEWRGRFVVDGSATRPPRVERLSVRLDPSAGAAGSQWFHLAGDHSGDYGALVLPVAEFPVHSATLTCVDLQLRLADGAGLDPFELMTAFSLSSTNGALGASVVALETGPFTDPQPAAMAGCLPARIWLKLTPAVESGLVRFTLAKGFGDKLGNETAAAETWTVLK